MRSKDIHHYKTEPPKKYRSTEAKVKLYEAKLRAASASDRRFFLVTLSLDEAKLLSDLAVAGGFTRDEIVEGVIKKYLQEYEGQPLVPRRKHMLAPRRPRGSPIWNQYGRFESVADAADTLNLHRRLIYAVLHGKRTHTAGYKFTYDPPKK